MNNQNSLFDTVLVPAGAQPEEPSLTPDLIHLAQGWRAVLPDLDGPGRRWLFTPWVTTQDTDLRGLVNRGDRLLIRGDAEDFLTGRSDMKAVQHLTEWGVEVQRMPTLHAKVYAREHEGQGVLWLGSANLSRRGADGGPHSPQVEAMSGPHLLTGAAITQLEYLWANSKPFSPDDIRIEVERLTSEREQLQQLLLDQAELGALALRLSFRLLSGEFTIPPNWLGHANEQAQRNRVKYPSVEYIDPDTTLAAQFRKFIGTEKRRLNELLENVPGMSGLYVLRIEDRLRVQEFLEEIERQARQRFEQQLLQERKHLRADFTERFQRAFSQFLSERTVHLALKPEVAATQAAEAFDEYTSRDPFRISAQFFIPLRNEGDPDDGLMQAMQRVRARQRLM